MRIISGKYRRLNLLSPVGLTTRPIPDRVKLSLFNILVGWIEGAVVLDLFCGTGSMGIECLSRGAKMVYFAERDRSALDLLGQNIANIGEQAHSHIWRGDIMLSLPTWLTELAEPVDVAFIDPPYEMVRTWDWSEAAAAIFDPVADKLRPEGLVELRCERATPIPATVGKLHVQSRRDYGGMSLVFLGAE
jgi:16S rRNA (guanine(966)-N(2))-methyltransferase RsmD